MCIEGGLRKTGLAVWCELNMPNRLILWAQYLDETRRKSVQHSDGEQTLFESRVYLQQPLGHSLR